MKEIVYPINEIIGKGLRPSKSNPRNKPYLVESIGAVPRDGVLQALDQLTRIDTSGLGALSFPYPQLFVLTKCIIVCTPTAIYELSGVTLTSKIDSLTVGTTWSVVDFQTFIYLTNGKVAVTKSPTTGVYTLSATLPYGTCLCDFNGQVLIGSPNTAAVGDI